jgi:senataxin
MLPSDVFYDRRLIDGPDMATKTVAPWHKSREFGPYRFYDVVGREQAGRGHSLVNEVEVGAAITLYRKLKREYGVGDSLFGKIGMISMYREQVFLLRNRFKAAFGDSCMDDIE